MNFNTLKYLETKLTELYPSIDWVALPSKIAGVDFSTSSGIKVLGPTELTKVKEFIEKELSENSKILPLILE